MRTPSFAIIAIALTVRVSAQGLPFEKDGIRFAYEPTVLFRSSADFIHAREPLLARRTDGALVCILYTGGRQEPSPSNVVAEVVSADDGATWSQPKVIFSHPTRACWATELFYEHGEKPQLFFQTFVADRFYEELRPFFSVSRGEGWTEPKSPFGVPPNFTVRQGHVLSDGSWLFPVYWQDCKAKWNTVVSYENGQPQWKDWKWEDYPFVSAAIRSTDKGRSWQVSNAMAGNEGVAWEIWEPCMVELEPGHVRMFARGAKPFLWEADSYDYGRMFGKPHLGGIPNATTKPTVFKRGKDVVLVNNVCKSDDVKRDKLEIWVSADNCVTWGKKFRIAEISKSDLWQICYPSAYYDKDKDVLYLALDAVKRHYLIKIPGQDLEVPSEAACSLSEYRHLVKSVNGKSVWTLALQTALDEHSTVMIPASEEKYYVDAPVRIPPGRRIEASGATIRLLDGTRTVMLFNAGAKDGTLSPIPSDNRDNGISIFGGRWEDCCTNRCGYGRSGMFNLQTRKAGNFFGVSTLFYFGNVDNVIVADATFVNCGAFAIQAGDGRNHRYENIVFENCFADGLHLNGNLEGVRVKNVRGSVGDDLVALNAYDWLNSSVNFGPQRDVVCEDLELIPANGRVYPAIRIQPAVYRYADGTTVDCSVDDIVFRRVKGITTFKMYLQTPRYEIGTEPEWSRVGSGGNILFEDVKIDLREPIDNICQYRDSDPLRGHFGVFEIGANLRSMTLRNVDVTFYADRWPQSHLVTVGPKSATYEDRGRKYEIFDPYVSCAVDTLRIEGLTMRGAEPAELVKEIEFDDVNGDGRSSGRGKVVEMKGKERTCLTRIRN